jgi:hypothetical protein
MIASHQYPHWESLGEKSNDLTLESHTQEEQRRKRQEFLKERTATQKADKQLTVYMIRC